jgi:hypothetical protein
MPESSGMALSNLLKASRPPAEAPTPTTGNKFSDKIFGLFESDILLDLTTVLSWPVRS